MINVGIIAISYNLPKDIQDRFIKYIDLSMRNSNLSYKVLIMTEKDTITTNQLFNKSKTFNIAIQQLINNTEVIICSDIDIILDIGTIDLTYKKAIQTNNNIFSMVRYIDISNISNFPYDKISRYYTIPLAYWGKGAWNGMTSENWYRSGGWNEELYGWGYEDIEFHNRLLKKGIDIYTLMTKILIHINHPMRNLNQNVSQQQNIEVSKSKDYLNYNWLEKKEL